MKGGFEPVPTGCVVSVDCGQPIAVGGEASTTPIQPAPHAETVEVLIPRADNPQRALLFEANPKDPSCMLRNMWAKFRGVTVVTAADFMAKWTIFEAMSGVDAGLLDRPVSKMIKASMSKPDARTIAAIFSEVPGVSKTTAPTYAALFMSTPAVFASADLLKDAKIASTSKKPVAGAAKTPAAVPAVSPLLPTKKIGPKKAGLIVQLIHMRVAPSAP